MTALPSWLGDDRLVMTAWSRLAEPGDRAAAAAREAIGAAAALGHVLTGRPLPLEVARRSSPNCPAGRGRRVLDEALQRWRVRMDDLDPARDLAAVERLGGRVLIRGDDEWPTGIDDLDSAAPVCLWVRGPVRLSDAVHRSVALVGSRACTAYGEHVTATIAGGTAERGLTVVSGAAFGIDAVAHRATLAVGGTTVAVLACGVDRVYPRAHANLLRHIGEQGLVVSESPLGGAPTRWRFLERNRLIAAMSSATVVVEAAWRSGALSTATRAAGLGRPLGAVPGPVTSASSAGCHRLLRELAATCVTDADEVAELASSIGDVQVTVPTVVARPHDDLEGTDLRVWEALPLGTASPPHSVAVVAGLPARQVLGALGRLGLRGLAQPVPAPDGSTSWRRTSAVAPEQLTPHRADRV